MKIKVYITVLSLVLLGKAYGQQQTLYTNYLMNQYVYNPAYAGVEDGTQFNLGYRNQWVGFDGAPKTYMVNGYGKLKKKPNMAVGGLVMTERIGLLQRTSFYGTYTYHLKINKNAAINFGLGVGGIQYKVRVYDAKPYDKDDSFLGSDVLRAFSFDANAGFYFYTKNFFLGFSDQQMPDSRIHWNNTNGKNTPNFYAYTGYNIKLDKDWSIQPSILARTNSPAPYQLEYNAKVIYDQMIWAGFSYRHQSSGCIMIGCKIDNQYSFAYSYDITLSALSKYSTGTHEIVLSYLIPFKRKKSKSELVKDADEEELNKIDNTLKTNLRNKKKKEKEKNQDGKTQDGKNQDDKTQGDKSQDGKTQEAQPEQGVNDQPQTGKSATEIPIETQKAPENQTGVGNNGSDTKAAPTTETPTESKQTEPEPKKENSTEPKK